MYLCSFPIRHLILTLAASAALFSSCPAQEIALVDLTKVAARVDLRRPKATSPVMGGYSGAQDIRPCFDPTHNAGALRTSLVSLDRTHYQLGDEPRFEVTVENIGSTPVRVPFSPHLADLQPKNPAEEFAYYELQIALLIAGDQQWETNTGGYVVLYGADPHSNTMLTLDAGEWLRIIGKGRITLDYEVVKLALSGHPADPADGMNAQASLYREKTLITAAQSATAGQEVCLAQTHGQSVPIQLSIP
jgi:hypothetical protein